MIENNSARLEFGVKLSALVNAAKSFNVIGTATVKTSKVLALAAVLSGASTEDVAKRTGIAEGTLKRTAAIVRNGIRARDNAAAVSPATISTALHGLDWTALTDEGADLDARYDATYAAAGVWDDYLIDTKTNTRTPAGPLSATDLAILVHDTIVNAADPAAYIAAVEDALASAAAKLEEGEE